ncbi:MAG: DUF72 domain-containing protein [Burkholderiaceae bacterium]
MQTALFPEPDEPRPEPASKRQASDGPVAAAPADPALRALAAALPAELRLGTSSWTYPGWKGLVWDREYTETALARQGLRAYAQHPLFRTVGLDRSFYRPLTPDQFAEYASQVPEDFRFVVKAPNLVTDPMRRDGAGRGLRPNPDFLDADAALREAIVPAAQGLGRRLGVVVFQISPLPRSWLGRIPALIERLHGLLRGIAPSSDAVVAVEVRDPQWLTSDLVAALRDTGATYCMALHAKMPVIADQLPLLRALWPGPFVCRWNLNPVHGAFGYEDARRQYEPFDRLVDPDPQTRATLARVIAGTVGAGHPAYVTLSNKAEGSSPLSVVALAQAVCDLRRPAAGAAPETPEGA